jgi:type IV secretory pathway TrbD component
VLYISSEALDPKGTDQLVTDMATGLKLLAIAGRHPTQLYVAGAGQLFTYVYFAGEFAAPVVMGFALWRSRRVPLWLIAYCLHLLEAKNPPSVKQRCDLRHIVCQPLLRFLSEETGNLPPRGVQFLGITASRNTT